MSRPRRRRDSTDYPPRGRGVAATPRTIHVPAAASPRLVSADCPRRVESSARRSGRDSPATRLAAVVRLDDTLRGVGPLLKTADGRKVAKAALDAPSFQTKAFKRAFNAYSDNVFYEKNDPDRANLYLLGGTPPSSKQTIQCDAASSPRRRGVTGSSRQVHAPK